MAKGSEKKQTVKKEDIDFVPPEPKPEPIPDDILYPGPGIAGDTANIGKGKKKGNRKGKG